MLRLICFISASFMLVGFSTLAQNASANQPSGENTRSIVIEFQPQINSDPLVLNTAYFIPELQDSVAIERFKFHLSDLCFTSANGTLYTAVKCFFLMDAENESSLKRTINLPANAEIAQLNFNVGIDSTTQVAGAQGGELDPTQGMYWTWQSGYINFKLEGKSPKCPARHHLFQFHIGGFQAPFNSLQFVALPTKNTNTLVVVINLNKLLTPENIAQHFEVMRPSQKAMDFAKTLPQAFSLTP